MCLNLVEDKRGYLVPRNGVIVSCKPPCGAKLEPWSPERAKKCS